MSRIIVVDDHPVFRKGLVALLRASGHDVVGEAASGLEAVDIVADTAPDVVIMDVAMPDLGGIEATEHLIGRYPDLRVVVLTGFDDEGTVRSALAAGASAYVTKQAAPEQILGAVDAAVGGALWLGEGVPRPLTGAPQNARVLPGLTARETEIADLVARGLTNAVIAERLHLSTKTVANYVSIIMLKLGASDRTDAKRLIRATHR